MSEPEGGTEIYNSHDLGGLYVSIILLGGIVLGVVLWVVTKVL